MSEAQETLFDALFNADEKKIKAKQKPLVIKRLKRKCQSAVDDAETRIMECEAEIDNLIADFENFKINEINKQKATITSLKSAQEYTKETYKALFGENLS